MWDGRDNLGRGAAAGVYVYSLISEGVRINKKMILVDGQGGTLSVTKLQQEQLLLPDQNTLKKQISDEYLFRVSGSNIETYEQQHFVVTSNMVFDVKVTRTVRDTDDNVYTTVKIGDQWWMAENLKVTRYRNGDSIPHVTDDSTWANLSEGACCSYDNNEANVAIYGRLYNWYAVNDSRNIAPAGWHVPSDAEWKTLEMYLGMSQTIADAVGSRGTDQGGKMKESGTSLWASPNVDATNTSFFSAVPGGYRGTGGHCRGIGTYATFWSSTEDGSGLAWYRCLNNFYSVVYRDCHDKRFSFSVRCVRD